MSFVLSALRFARRSVMLLLLIGSLAFTVASHTVAAVGGLVSAAIYGLSGVATTTVELRRAATTQAARADGLARDLGRERTRNRALRSQLDDALRPVTFRGQRMAAREATRTTLSSVRQRTARVATTNLATIPGESIPVYGMAVVLAATAWELQQACTTMTELDALEAALSGTEPAPEAREKVCGMSVPTREEVWSGILAAPAAAWETSVTGLKQASDAMPDLPAPDFDSWWRSASAWLGSLWVPEPE